MPKLDLFAALEREKMIIQKLFPLDLLSKTYKMGIMLEYTGLTGIEMDYTGRQKDQCWDTVG